MYHCQCWCTGSRNTLATFSIMSAFSVSAPPFWSDITLTLGHAFFVKRSTFWNKSFDLFFLPFSSISSHIPFKWSILSCLSFARTCRFSSLYFGSFLRQLRFSSIKAKVSGLIHSFLTVRTCLLRVLSAVSVKTAFSCCHCAFASTQFNGSAASGVSNSWNRLCSSSWNCSAWQ